MVKKNKLFYKEFNKNLCYKKFILLNNIFFIFINRSYLCIVKEYKNIFFFYFLSKTNLFSVEYLS